MTSQINANNINGNYPIAGKPNSTEGMRTNFTNTKTNFQYAADEITELQAKSVFKTALTGTTLDNNMNDNLIYAVKLNDASYTYLQNTTTSGAVTIDYSASQYQLVSPTGSVSLNFSNWPASGSEGVIYVDVVVTNTAYTLTLPGAVSLGISGIQGLVTTYNPDPPYAVSYSILTFGTTGTYRFGFSSANGGTTVAVYDLNRPLSYYTNAVNVAATTASTSTTSGALIVAGGVGIGGDLYVGGDIYGNLSATDLNLGNVVASGYISAIGNIVGNNIIGNYVLSTISTTGNVIGGNVLTAGLISATGNLRGGNINTAGLISATGNVYGGNVLNSGISSVAGNITGGNILTGGLVSATGNITAGNILTAGVVSATANITGGNVLTTGVVSATANITGGNVLTAGLVSATGNIRTSGFFVGDGGYLSNITVYSNVAATQIISGTTQMAVEVPSGNIQATIGGTANVVVFRPTGINITGLVSATGNITGGNVLAAGLISATGNVYGGNVLNSGISSATGNIIGGNILTGGLISATSTITSTANITGGNVLTSGIMSSTGNAIHGNILTSGLISASGTITGSSHLGTVVSVSGNITGGNILTGGIISATGNITSGNIAVTGNVSLTGNVIAGNITTSGTVALGNITGGNLLTDGQARVMSNTAPTAGGVAAYLMSSTANLGVFFGSGVPTISAAQGSLYMRTDGSSTSTRMYVNTNGTTGWTAVTTAT